MEQVLTIFTARGGRGGARGGAKGGAVRTLSTSAEIRC
jgi:hypothetical protein